MLGQMLGLKLKLMLGLKLKLKLKPKLRLGLMPRPSTALKGGKRRQPTQISIAIIYISNYLYRTWNNAIF